MNFKEIQKLATEYDAWADGKLPLKANENVVKWVDKRKAARAHLERHAYTMFPVLLKALKDSLAYDNNDCVCESDFVCGACKNRAKFEKVLKEAQEVE